MRKGFTRLLDKIENNDVLVVTKLDRLGRDAIDVSVTVARLEKMGVKVHCLALGGVDLTSSAGKMTMGVINTVAQFERDLLIERTQSRSCQSKVARESFGAATSFDRDTEKAGHATATGRKSHCHPCKRVDTSRQTIMRVRNSTQSYVPRPQITRISHFEALSKGSVASVN